MNPRLLRSGLTDRVYVITRYKVLDTEQDRIEAITKHDVTADYEALVKGTVYAPVGGMEIAERLGVKRETVAMWKQRGLLPPARWTVSGEDAWDWHLDIEPWARQTGRRRDKESE